MNNSARRYREYKRKLEEGLSDYSTDDREVLEEAGTLLSKAADGAKSANDAVSSLGKMGSTIRSWFGSGRGNSKGGGNTKEIAAIKATAKDLHDALEALKPQKVKFPKRVNFLVKQELESTDFKIADIAAVTQDELEKEETDAEAETRTITAGGVKNRAKVAQNRESKGESSGGRGGGARVQTLSGAISDNPTPVANALAGAVDGDAVEAKAAVKSGEDAVAEFIAKGVTIPDVDKAKAATIISALIKTDALKIKVENRHFMSSSDFQILRESNKKMNRWLQLAGLESLNEKRGEAGEERAKMLAVAQTPGDKVRSAAAATAGKKATAEKRAKKADNGAESGAAKNGSNSPPAESAPAASPNTSSDDAAKIGHADLAAAIGKDKASEVLKILDKKATEQEILAVFNVLKPKLVTSQ